MTSKPKTHKFRATIYKIWMMRHVDVPEEISAALAKACVGAGTGQQQAASKPKYIPVVAIVNGRSARTTLVPAGAGRYRLQLNTALRKAAHADTGDVVSVAARSSFAKPPSSTRPARWFERSPESVEGL